MTKTELLNDIEQVVKYLWEDERKNWEEADMPENHIFHSINRLNTFINE